MPKMWQPEVDTLHRWKTATLQGMWSYLHAKKLKPKPQHSLGSAGKASTDEAQIKQEGSNMGMSRRFVEAIIRDNGWQPYIKSHWLDFGRQGKRYIPSTGRGGVIITFKGHEQHEYKCSHKTAKEILDLAKGIVK